MNIHLELYKILDCSKHKAIKNEVHLNGFFSGVSK